MLPPLSGAACALDFIRRAVPIAFKHTMPMHAQPGTLLDATCRACVRWLRRPKAGRGAPFHGASHRWHHLPVLTRVCGLQGITVLYGLFAALRGFCFSILNNRMTRRLR